MRNENIQGRLKTVEKAIKGKDIDPIEIILEDGTRERWQDIDLMLSIFEYPNLPINIIGDRIGRTVLSDTNLPISYKYEKSHPRGFAQYQMWLISWLDVMVDIAAGRQKGKP